MSDGKVILVSNKTHADLTSPGRSAMPRVELVVQGLKWAFLGKKTIYHPCNLEKDIYRVGGR